IIEDVTLKIGGEVEARIRFRGGATRCVKLAKPLRSWEKRRTASEVVKRIDRLLEDHTEAEVAVILNRQGLRPGLRDAFHRRQVQSLRAAYDLKSRWERLRARGLLTRREMATKHGVCVETISRWRREGKVRGHLLNETPAHLYEPKKLGTMVESAAISEEMSQA
ncbi:transposase, partial [mine drainage metagenome]